MARLAFPAIGALAVEVIDLVLTVPSVLTWVSTALVHIEVTEGALPAIRTETLKGIDAINAGATIPTGATYAVVHILMAVCSSEAWLTGASEVSGWLTDTAAVRATYVG